MLNSYLYREYKDGHWSIIGVFDYEQLQERVPRIAQVFAVVVNISYVEWGVEDSSTRWMVERSF